MKAYQNDKLIAEGKGVYNFIRIDNSPKQKTTRSFHREKILKSEIETRSKIYWTK